MIYLLTTLKCRLSQAAPVPTVRFVFLPGSSVHSPSSVIPGIALGKGGSNCHPSHLFNDTKLKAQSGLVNLSTPITYWDPVLECYMRGLGVICECDNRLDGGVGVGVYTCTQGYVLYTENQGAR
jgi:hypothetical protein